MEEQLGTIATLVQDYGFPVIMVVGLGYYVYSRPFRFERIFHNKDFERSVLLPIVTLFYAFLNHVDF